MPLVWHNIYSPVELLQRPQDDHCVSLHLPVADDVSSEERPSRQVGPPQPLGVSQKNGQWDLEPAVPSCEESSVQTTTSYGSGSALCLYRLHQVVTKTPD